MCTELRFGWTRTTDAGSLERPIEVAETIEPIQDMALADRILKHCGQDPLPHWAP